jgi:hypothetical protein
MNEAAKKPTILRLLRRIMSANGPAALGQSRNDPHHTLERLESWSANATLVILAGILGEIAVLWLTPHTCGERIWGTVTDALIAVGLIVEYFVILSAIVATGEANRESDEKVARAQLEAAEARERTAEVEKLTAWRRVSPEQSRTIAEAVRRNPSPLSVVIEFQSNDPEAYTYALDIVKIFEDAGIVDIGFRGNMYIIGAVFGLWMGVAPDTDASLVISAFGQANISLGVQEKLDFFRHPSAGDAARNLYIFVGSKLAPTVVTTTHVDATHTSKNQPNASHKRESNI